jgi:hypothetical protein
MSNNILLNELMRIDKLVYQPSKLLLDNIVNEKEHADYGALTFTLNKAPVKFRVSKITPIKIGCFVALWKRDDQGDTVPYDAADDFEFYIIHVVQDDGQCGQFVFPKAVLLKNKVLSEEGKGGKRGFRLYPRWDKAESKQALKTQAWQVPYFFEINPKQPSAMPNVLRQVFAA